MAKPFFITTPIYYVNDVPHIGHAYTTVAAGVFARWKRGSGEVRLLTGTDEHGEKIEKAAAKAEKTPKTYADEIASVFKSEWEKLGINFDRFIRTTDSDHEATVREFLMRVHQSGYIKKGTYEGLYCVGHEAFLSESDLVDGKCPDHQTVPEIYKEDNYFFALSTFRDRLQKAIQSGELSILPVERKNEIIGKLEKGLEDISISRRSEKTRWGIPIPWDETQTIYVWVDALINYYTYGKREGIWPADLHLVGKDILWFHTVIWPALLWAAGEEAPRQVFAHGFFTINGQKMSKTIGNVITPQALIDTFGVGGARYLLLSAFPFGADGDFSWGRLIEKYNAELANGIGNLTARITTLALEEKELQFGLDEEFGQLVGLMSSKYVAAMERLDFFGATVAIQELVKYADQYLNTKRPWGIKGDEKRIILKNLLGVLAHIANLSLPFMRDISYKIFTSVGIQADPDKWDKAEMSVTRGDVLFPRIDAKAH